MKNEIRKILSDSFDEISPVLTESQAYSDDLVLISSNKESVFDSIALVTFISAIETMILETLDINITIVSGKAFSRENSPFKTMETLGMFIEELIKETE